MAESAENEVLRQQAEKIIASGVLGRSRFYKSLLEYLIDCRERGHTPKEIEIATEVFNRGDGFDPSQDSMVRVYAHNLRQKLQQFYAEQGADEPDQISIPKGEYRIVLTAPEETPIAGADAQPLAGRAAGGSMRLGLLVLVGIVVGILLDRAVTGSASTAYQAHQEVAASALWSEVSDDELPVTVVVGDYFIFGELDEIGNVRRMVREFDINSSRELDELIMLEPEVAERYFDLDLTYLPSSTAFALRDVMAVLIAAGKELRVVAMSDLDTSVIRDSHVVYLGFLSGLGMLADFVFGGSELAVGETFDELVHQPSARSFISEAGLPSERGSYRDYGLFTTLPGPAGNQLVFIAGMRDEALMQTAQAVSNPTLVPASIEAIAAAMESGTRAYEVLYEVAGLDRTNLDARIVHIAPLDSGRVSIGRLEP